MGYKRAAVSKDAAAFFFKNNKNKQKKG